jgi:hypothetical protein
MAEHEYCVKGVKSFEGMEGYGFNATLYKGNKKVAKVIDDAHGGDYMYYWEDRDKPRVPGEVLRYDGTVFKTDMTPAQAALHEFLKGKTYDCPYTGETHPQSRDGFLAELVDSYEETKRLKSLCKKHVVIQTDKNNEGEVCTFKAEPTVSNIAKVRLMLEKRGDKVIEVINDRFV